MIQEHFTHLEMSPLQPEKTRAFPVRDPFGAVDMTRARCVPAAFQYRNGSELISTPPKKLILACKELVISGSY